MTNVMTKRIQPSKCNRRNEWFDSKCHTVNRATRLFKFFKFKQTRAKKNFRNYLEKIN